MTTRRAIVILIGLAIGALASAGAAAQAPSANPQAEEIRAVLKAQSAAWNAKDIRGFMAYYWPSEELTFQSGGNRIRGWQAMLDRYLKNYSGDQWGQLEFGDLEIHVLGPEAAYVLGRWKVERHRQDRPGGFYHHPAQAFTRLAHRPRSHLLAKAQPTTL